MIRYTILQPSAKSFFKLYFSEMQSSPQYNFDLFVEMVAFEDIGGTKYYPEIRAMSKFTTFPDFYQSPATSWHQREKWGSMRTGIKP
jgi:hypothetical protein